MTRHVIALALVIAGGCEKKPPAPPSIELRGETVVPRLGEAAAGAPTYADGIVRLRALGGETLAIVVAGSGEGAISAAISSLGEGVRVDRFAVRSVPVVEPSTSLFGPSRGRGAYFDRLVAGDEPSSHVLFDIVVAPDAAPGVRRAELSIEGATRELWLEVLPHSIDLSRAPLVWVWYDTREVGTRADELAHRALFLAHGALFATDPAPSELEARRELIVPTALYWPVRIRSEDPNTLRDNARRVIEFFAPLAATPFTIPIDEPRDDEVRRRVVANGEVIRSAGGGPGRLLHAVTDRARPIYGDEVDVFIAAANVREDAPEPWQRWTYNGRPPSAASMVVDGDGSLRSWGWIGFRYSVELWYAWNGTYYTDVYNRAPAPTDFERSMVSFDERRKGGDDFGNGDGVLVYPGMQPSMRLKALRRGLQDRLLLAKLVACGGADEADAIARATIPRALGDAAGGALWPRDEAGWELARSATLDAIAARCPPQ